MNMFKKIIMVAGLALASLTVTAQPYYQWAAAATSNGTTLARAVVSAQSFNNGTPVVNFLSVTADAKTNTVAFFVPTAATSIMSNYFPANTTGCSLTNVVMYTNGFVAGQMVIIRHVATDTYDANVIASVQGTSVYTNLTTTNGGLIAMTWTNLASITSNNITGDILYPCQIVGSVPFVTSSTANTLTLGPGPIVGGKKGWPLLIQLTGSNACSINAVSATYTP